MIVRTLIKTKDHKKRKWAGGQGVDVKHIKFLK